MVLKFIEVIETEPGFKKYINSKNKKIIVTQRPESNISNAPFFDFPELTVFLDKTKTDWYDFVYSHELIIDVPNEFKNLIYASRLIEDKGHFFLWFGMFYSISIPKKNLFYSAFFLFFIFHLEAVNKIILRIDNEDNLDLIFPERENFFYAKMSSEYKKRIFKFIEDKGIPDIQFMADDLSLFLKINKGRKELKIENIIKKTA